MGYPLSAVHRGDLGGLTALLQQEEKRNKTVTQKCQDIEKNTIEEYLSVVNEIAALRSGTIQYNTMTCCAVLFDNINFVLLLYYTINI